MCTVWIIYLEVYEHHSNVQDQWRKKEERVQAKALASQVEQELIFNSIKSFHLSTNVGMPLKVVEKTIFFLIISGGLSLI